MKYSELIFESSDFDELNGLYDRLDYSFRFNKEKHPDLSYKIIRKYNADKSKGTIKVKVLKLDENKN